MRRIFFTLIASFLIQPSVTAELGLQDLDLKLIQDRIETALELYLRAHPEYGQGKDRFYVQNGQLHLSLSGSEQRKQTLRNWLSAPRPMRLERETVDQGWQDTGLSTVDFPEMQVTSYEGSCNELKGLGFSELFLIDSTQYRPEFKIRVAPEKLIAILSMMLGEELGIFLDNQLIGAPTVNGTASDGYIRLELHDQMQDYQQLENDLLSGKAILSFKRKQNGQWQPLPLNSQDIIDTKLTLADPAQQCVSSIAVLPTASGNHSRLRQLMNSDKRLFYWAFRLEGKPVFYVYPYSNARWAGLFFFAQGHFSQYQTLQRQWSLLNQQLQAGAEGLIIDN